VLSPSAGHGIGNGVDPTTLLGSLAISPAAGHGIGSGTNPAVVLGSLAISPAAGYGVGNGVDPTVLVGTAVSVAMAATSYVFVTKSVVSRVWHGIEADSQVCDSMQVISRVGGTD